MTAIIDIYTHIIPAAYLDALSTGGPALGDLNKRLRSIRSMLDLEARFREMDGLGDYRQVISLPNPPIEEIAAGKTAAQLARIANEAMAELCARHPDRFAGFVAAVSLDDMDQALGEIDRAIDQLGAKGVLIYSNVAGHPLDEARFESLFAAMARLDAPIWLHPARSATMPDYASEPKSRFEMWWCFGWPYETSVAMARLVFCDVFDRYPGLKVITHHLGGMVPYFEGRVGSGLEVLGRRTPDEDYSTVLTSLKRPHLDYFREFFADTALFGARSGLRTGIDFFSPERVVFASDSPLSSIPAAIAALGEIGLSQGETEMIMSGNARRLLKLAA